MLLITLTDYVSFGKVFLGFEAALPMATPANVNGRRLVKKYIYIYTKYKVSKNLA